MSLQREPGTSGVFSEIVRVAGEKAAWALAEARGGQEIFVPQHPGPKHWLSQLVGAEAAERICHHFRENHQSRLLVPMMSRHRRQFAVARAMQSNVPNNAVAAELGVHERTVRRYRRKLRGDNGDDRQGRLF